MILSSFLIKIKKMKLTLFFLLFFTQTVTFFVNLSKFLINFLDLPILPEILFTTYLFINLTLVRSFVWLSLKKLLDSFYPFFIYLLFCFTRLMTDFVLYNSCSLLYFRVDGANGDWRLSFITFNGLIKALCGCTISRGFTWFINLGLYGVGPSIFIVFCTLLFYFGLCDEKEGGIEILSLDELGGSPTMLLSIVLILI